MPAGLLSSPRMHSLVWLLLGAIASWLSAVNCLLYFGFPAWPVGVLVFYLWNAWEARKWEGFGCWLPLWMLAGFVSAMLLIPGIGPSPMPSRVTLAQLLSLHGPCYQLNYAMISIVVCASAGVLLAPRIKKLQL